MPSSFISKDEYEQWEKRVSELAHASVKGSSLIPSDKRPVILTHQKIVLVFDMTNSNPPLPASKDIENGSHFSLNQSEYIDLYHMGQNKIDKVKSGYDSENKVYMHPASDYGGLTNYRQPLDTKSKLISNSSFRKIYLSHSTPEKDIKKMSREIYNEWKRISNKSRLYGNIKHKTFLLLESLLKAIQNGAYNGAYLRFWKTPKVRKVLCTAKWVHSHTGQYYVRQFGKGYAQYAKKVHPSSLGGLYCSVWKLKSEYKITPNINIYNLKNEYTQ